MADLKEKKKYIVIGAVVMVLIVVAAALLILLIPRGEEKKPHATMDDLLNSKSTRAATDPGAVIVALDRPYHVLAATPVALYYDGADKHASPLLVAGVDPNTGEEGTSKSVTRFLEAYSPSDVLGVGPTPQDISVASAVAANDSEEASLELATTYWKSSDGALLVKPDAAGYAMAVNAVPLACYLDIPVIVTEREGKDVDAVLKYLGVRYTLICGDLEGYGKIWPFPNKEEVQAVLATGYPDSTGAMKSIIKDRVGLNASYVTIANPMDIVTPKVVAEFSQNFTGEVTHSDTGSTSFPTSSADAPTFYMSIPEDYKYARVIVDSELLCVQPRTFGTPQSHGERSYVYFGTDSDKDGQMVHDPDTPTDTIHFMSPSLGYSYKGDGSSVYCIGHTDYPIYNSTGEKIVQIKASLDYKVTQDPNIPGPGTIREIDASTTTFSITVTVQKLESYNYPRLVGASSLASYLAAFRGGLVMASPAYGIHDATTAARPNSGDPAVNRDLYLSINEKAAKVKTELNNLLGKLAGMDGSDWPALAEHYQSLDPKSPMYVGVIADPYMVPWYYYVNTGQVDYGESEGFGTPSDSGYANIDLDLDNPPFDIDGGQSPDMELAIGRMTGWTIMDTSALLARTFFYYDIIDTFQGHGPSWKESGIVTHGDVVPVGGAETVVRKLQAAFTQSGFTVDASHNFARSDSKLSAPIYETSNFIFECAHGHYYWFVPPGYKGTGAGGGFHVANVRDMNFGPGILFASSCVTGKIDGIPLYNALSQAFIFSGLNCYVGASRLSWGTFVPAVWAESGEAFGGYMGMLFYGYLTGYVYDRNGGLVSEDVGDLSTGAALMLAKNYFSLENPSDGGGAGDDTIEEFNIHGDPAFNPYEPNHSG